MQKSVIFVKKNLRKDIWKIKKYREVRDHCHYRGAYRDNARSICNLKHYLPKKIPIIFYSRSNYDYHFVIKELAEEFENQSICLGENTKKCINFTVPIEKELIKMKKKLQKVYLSWYNLLTVQDVWQVLHKILLIIYLKVFVELNVN